MLIVDRFEGKYAIIEDGDVTFSVLKKRLPINVKAGDVVIADEDKFVIDEETTQKRKNNIEKAALDLWKN